AQKASQIIAADQRKAKEASLTAAITTLIEEHAQNITDLAQVHNVTVEKVTKLVCGHTNYKKKWGVSLANVLLFVKRREVNDHLPEGSKHSLQQIWQMIANDPAMQNLTKEQKDKYKAELQEHHSIQGMSMRATNFAAAEDMATTLDNIFSELDGLAVQTGIYASLWVTRGHSFNTHCTTWYGTDNAMDFWEDVLKLEPHAVVKKFELWACNQDQS
ncbi:hypothetical protein BDN67DRAFT_871490, partial [Paxillus ammoniavirescens]